MPMLAYTLNDWVNVHYKSFFTWKASKLYSGDDKYLCVIHTGDAYGIYDDHDKCVKSAFKIWDADKTEVHKPEFKGHLGKSNYMGYEVYVGVNEEDKGYYLIFPRKLLEATEGVICGSKVIVNECCMKKS